jgi:hypothetical protein
VSTSRLARRFFAEVSHSRGVGRDLEESAVAAAREGRASPAPCLELVAATTAQDRRCGPGGRTHARSHVPGAVC